jgi:putative membrane protein
MRDFEGMNGGEWGWQRGLFLLLIVIALVVGTVLVVRMWLARPHNGGRPFWLGGGPGGGHAPHNPALAELDLRYARGEMPREEYLQRRADLLGHVGGPPASPPPPI